jgi:hypothetical protein
MLRRLDRWGRLSALQLQPVTTPARKRRHGVDYMDEKRLGMIVKAEQKQAGART